MTTTTSTTAATSPTSGIGSSILTTLNAGSGIDTDSLITKLVAAEKAPQQNVLDSRTTTNQAKVSALADATSGIDSFASALSSLVSGGSLFTQATSSDSSIVGVSALAGSRIGNLSSTIEVKGLAQAQILNAPAVASASTAIGTGSFTLTNNGVTKTITLDNTNNTLAGLAAAVNAANVGVSASIINDTTGARLVLKGATGANYNFTMTANPGADPSLSQFTWDGTSASGMSQAQAAKDASLVVDGVAISRPTNSFSDVIQGVKITLNKAAVGSTVTVGSSFPSDAISQAVTNFVAAYNELQSTLSAATAPPAADGTGGGALAGNSAIRSMQSQLSRLTSTPLITSGTGPKTLAEIGVATQRDGTLKVDTDKLSAMLASDPDGVEALFNPTQTSSSPLINITSAMGKTKPGTYTLTNIVAGPPASGQIAGVAALSSGNSLIASGGSSAVGLVITPTGNVSSATITIDPGLAGALQMIQQSLEASTGPLASLKSQLDRETTSISDAEDQLNTRITNYQDLLTTQFTAMNTNIAAINATKSYLTQQIAIWTGSNNNN